MSLTSYKKQFIRLVTRDTSSALEVYAVLFESDGVNTVAISEPKLIRIVKKAKLALSGFCSKCFSLKSWARNAEEKPEPIPSPYFPTLFGNTNADFVIQVSARPPTLK